MRYSFWQKSSNHYLKEFANCIMILIFWSSKSSRAKNYPKVQKSILKYYQKTQRPFTKLYHVIFHQKRNPILTHNAGSYVKEFAKQECSKFASSLLPYSKWRLVWLVWVDRVQFRVWSGISKEGQAMRQPHATMGRTHLRGVACREGEMHNPLSR